MLRGAPPGVSPQELEDLAARAAVAAGRLVVEERPVQLSAAATKSSPTDIVTVMDTKAEELIRRLLLAERPQDGILGEEGEDHRGTSGMTWVVDPIDGTVNYLYDIPAYGVSVAAVTGDPRVPGRWQVVASAVADPALRRVYHAALHGGAWERDWQAPPERAMRLAPGPVDDLSRALVGTGFGYTAERRLRQAQLLITVLPRVRDIRRIGSAALDLCAVAAGRLDAFYETGLNPWDMAAGWLIVEESGGVVSGPGGGPPSDALTVAGNAAVHRQLLDVIEEFGAAP